MKYLTPFALVYWLCVATSLAQKPTEQTSTTLLLKGKFSSNSENENNSPDPKFNASFITPAKIPDLKSTNSKRLVEMENGLQVIEDVVDKIIKEKYSFSLLSQHKYMITDCLGVKASVGEFNVQFGNPEIKLNDVRKVVIKLIVDEIRFTALKIRMRPCPKDLQCHFSERFNIGGLARDLTMTVTMDPMAMIAASTGICAFSFKGPITVHWRLKSLNLQPLQNNLDDVAKQMIEDALNASTLNIVRDRFISIAKTILPQYFETCKDLYPSPGEGMDVVKGTVKNNESKKNEETQEVKENTGAISTEKWEITPNPDLKGAMGRITIRVPEKSVYSLTVFKAGTDEKSAYRYIGTEFLLLPGQYDTRWWDNSKWRLSGVPVRRGMDTRIRAGMLNINLKYTEWVIYDETKTTVIEQGYDVWRLGLPVGKYYVKVNNDFVQVVIKDGEVTEF